MKITRKAIAPAMFKRLALLPCLVSLALPVYAGGLSEVEQTIFGMDCAPCAYGIEHGLKKLPGVTDVRVSLNEGRAIVALAADSSTTLERIRKVIRDNGFTPKAARVTVIGTLVHTEDGMWLVVPRQPHYRLTAKTDAVATTLHTRPNGAIVRLQGEIPETAAVASEVTVTQVLE